MGTSSAESIRLKHPLLNASRFARKRRPRIYAHLQFRHSLRLPCRINCYAF